MSKRWCPSCETVRHAGDHYIHGPECNDCDTALEAIPRPIRLWQTAKAAPFIAVLLAMVLLPPASALLNHWGDPLLSYETVTVTVTRPTLTGLLPALVVSLGFPMLVLLILFAVAYGPRRTFR